MVQGFATTAGTERYARRFAALRDAGHFRSSEAAPEADELWLSSLGVGTYLGEADDATDAAYAAAIAEALGSGMNVVDSAINYRNQRSERNVGAALGQMIANGKLRRDEVLVCSKAGFLALDGDVPADPQAYFIENYIHRGILRPGEIAGGMHAMAPRYLEDQLERSRKNLGVETIDVYYLHNPETQLGAGIDRAEFRKRLRAAFAALEGAAAAGKIRFYGCATWNGFRVPREQRDFLSGEEVAAIAREVGGNQHRCRFLQLPFNLAMPEAFTIRNQPWNGEMLSALEAARRAGMAVVGSATLYQAKLIQRVPDKVRQALGASSELEAAIQFARSAPGITTSLIGMARAEHVRSNVKVAAQPLVAEEQWSSLFAGTG